MGEHDDHVKLVYLWSLQEMRGRRPAKIEPPKWASRKRNIDSFLLFAKLRRLPKVPTFADAVIQQKQVLDDFSTSDEEQADLPAGILDDLPAGILDGIVDKNPRGLEDQVMRDFEGEHHRRLREPCVTESGWVPPRCPPARVAATF